MELICVVRDVYRALSEIEVEIVNEFGMCVNEMIVVCSLSNGGLSASEISEKTGMKASHLSKVIKLIEGKGFITRELGKMDKRQMYFELTDKGCKLLVMANCKSFVIPEILRPVFNNKIKIADENKY